MKRPLIHVIVLALALVLANAECAMACVNTPCADPPSQAPPCHRHNTERGCPHAMFVAEIGKIQGLGAPHGIDVFVPGEPVEPVRVQHTGDVAVQATSLPQDHRLSAATVLKI